MRATITKKQAARMIVELLEDNFINARSDASIGLNDEGTIERFYNAHGFAGMQLEFATTEDFDHVFENGENPYHSETWNEYRDGLVESFERYWITEKVIDAHYGDLTWKVEV